MSAQQSNPLYRWTFRGDHKILVTAVGFGIGPKIAAENLLIELKAAEENEPIEWHDTGLDEIAPLLEIRLLLNFGVIHPLPEFSAQRRVWIDCVDWLRTRVPGHIKEYDLLLREAFFPSPADGDRGDPKKWKDVQPTIRTPKRAANPNQDLILLSFGGITTPYSTHVHEVDMPLAFLRGICGFLDEEKQKRVQAFLPDYLVNACKADNLQNERLQLNRLDRRVFQEAMSRCGMLICQAGLYTPFEATKMGVPFVLTYPMSFTQDRQAAKYREMGIECFQIPWIGNAVRPCFDTDIEEIEADWYRNTTFAWTAVTKVNIPDYVLSKLTLVLKDSNRKTFQDFWYSELPAAQAVLY